MYIFIRGAEKLPPWKTAPKTFDPRKAASPISENNPRKFALKVIHHKTSKLTPRKMDPLEGCLSPGKLLPKKPPLPRMKGSSTEIFCAKISFESLNPSEKFLQTKTERYFQKKLQLPKILNIVLFHFFSFAVFRSGQ